MIDIDILSRLNLHIQKKYTTIDIHHTSSISGLQDGLQLFFMIQHPNLLLLFY